VPPEKFHTLLDAALAYASRGWCVFPCKVGGKEPATARGFHDATLNPAKIRRWWSAQPFNIGIRTGAISGLWVVDEDEGGELPGGLPPVPTVETGRGRHLYFATSTDLPTTAGRIGLHIDTRGGGGYVLAPPSLHPTGRRYRWAVGGDLVPPPAWLVDMARKRTNSEHALAARGAPPPPIRGNGYGAAALRGEIDALARCPKGARNDALNRSAFRLGRLVAGGEIAEADVIRGLRGACVTNGLLEDDGPHIVDRTIASGLAAGKQHPRGRAA
jgi:hypothetical protein